METVRILLVGHGLFGRNHLRVLQKLSREVYVADKRNDVLRQLEKNGFDKKRMSCHPEDFLDKVDAVDIVTPTDSHFDVAKKCLKSGKDIFVEKPLTKTSLEARKLIALAEKNDRILQVGHIFRYNPATRFIREALQSGSLGKLRYLSGHYMGFKRPRTDVGVTQTDSIHYFDLFNFLLGRMPVSVTAVMRDFLGRGMEDVSVVFLNYGDALAQVESGYFAPGVHRDVTLVGARRTIVSDLVKQDVQIYENYHIRRNNKWAAEQGKIIYPKIISQEPLELELESFIQSVRTRRKPLADGASGFDTLKIVEAAARSSRLKKEVPVA